MLQETDGEHHASPWSPPNRKIGPRSPSYKTERQAAVPERRMSSQQAVFPADRWRLSALAGPDPVCFPPASLIVDSEEENPRLPANGCASSGETAASGTSSPSRERRWKLASAINTTSRTAFCNRRHFCGASPSQINQDINEC